MAKTHYGDEDPEFPEVEDEEELFETAKHLGWTPDDMHDKEFAAKYKVWLEKNRE
jgi:hypothetical protein